MRSMLKYCLLMLCALFMLGFGTALAEDDVLTLPAGTTEIGNYAFYATTPSVVIVPDGATTIGTQAFGKCEKLTRVELPGSMTFIADDAFIRCPAGVLFIVDDYSYAYEWCKAHGVKHHVRGCGIQYKAFDGTVTFGETSASKQLTVINDSIADITYPSKTAASDAARWLTVTGTGTTATVRARAHYGINPRTEMVVVTCRHGEEYTFNVTQNVGSVATYKPELTMKLNNKTLVNGQIIATLPDSEACTLVFDIASANVQHMEITLTDPDGKPVEGIGPDVPYAGAALTGMTLTVPAGMKAGKYSLSIIASNSNIVGDNWQRKLTRVYKLEVKDSNGIPAYQLCPDIQPPEKVIDGYSYIGVLEFPYVDSKGRPGIMSQNIMSTWSDALLDIASCRYHGSPYMNDLVLMGHSYTKQFGYITQLKVGDRVAFTDMDGNRFEYEVALLETIPANGVDEMINSPYDLTLFTCTTWNVARTTVRCNKVK